MNKEIEKQTFDALEVSTSEVGTFERQYLIEKKSTQEALNLFLKRRKLATKAQPVQTLQSADVCVVNAVNSLEFIQKTNAEYSAWCKNYYKADALDERGMMSLHGLWAWQEQERCKIRATIT